jgi:hypothetical protein
LLGSKIAPLTTLNGLSDLKEPSWISLLTNSFPDPAGPVIKIRLSVLENLSIAFLNFATVDELPINSLEE